MSSFCLTCTIALERHEGCLGILLIHNFAGSEEKEATDVVTIEAFFSTGEDRDAAAAALEEFSAGSVSRRYTVEDQDWNARWRASMAPVKVAEGVWVSPVWLAPPLDPDDRWIKIEPKMAFGTGHHATTRLAAQAVIAEARGGGHPGSMLDIGAGSGVLCFVAGLCGVSWSIGLEIDPECRENLAENRSANSLGNRTDFVIGGIACLQAKVRFDLVVMNMIHQQSAPVLRIIREHLRVPGGTLVWSGILAEGRREARDAAADAGFSLVNETVEDEWWCGTFR